MRQSINAKPFSQILAEPVPLEGRWAALAPGRVVARPAVRRVGEAKLSTAAVRVLAGLAEGTSVVRSPARADTALVVDVPNQGGTDSFLFRTRSKQLYGTPKIAQSPDAAALFAAYLLLGRVPDFSAAYLELLKGLETNLPQVELDGLMASAADELVLACDIDLGLDDQPVETVWFYFVSPTGDAVSEFTEAGLILTPLLREPDTLSDYLAGVAGEFDQIKLPRL